MFIVLCAIFGIGMSVEFHHIGTPPQRDDGPAVTDWVEVVSVDGRIYHYSESTNQAVWSLPTKGTASSVFEAALDGNVDLLRTCVPSSTCGWDVRTSGLTMMHYALVGNRGPVVDLLLTKMARPHAPTLEGVSPLALACRYGRCEMARKLISAGALVPGVDKQGNTCLHEAAGMAQNHCLEMILNLVTSERNSSILSHMIWTKNTVQRTAYDVAVAYGFPDTAELILKYMRRYTQT